MFRSYAKKKRRLRELNRDLVNLADGRFEILKIKDADKNSCLVGLYDGNFTGLFQHVNF